MNLKSILFGLLGLWVMICPAMAEEIKAGKGLVITIKGVPEIEQQGVDGEYPVSESGTINMPHIGIIKAAGMRPEALASLIQSLYVSKGIYRNPTIQVISNSQQGGIDEQMVTVGGQVARPGPVKFVDGMTLYQAVQNGGGATPFGSMKRVKLFRGGTQREYNLTLPQFMRIQLEPDDTIEVPQKKAIEF